MSIITHIAVYATDLEKTRNYYLTFFGGKSNEIYRNSDGFSSYFITFDGNVSLEIMNHHQLEHREVLDKVNGWSHIAFSVGSSEKVEEITRRIVAAGYELYSSPRNTGDGYFESCVADPDGNRVEITI
jgi:Lactoylglutathione lyase and related lyases